MQLEAVAVRGVVTLKSRQDFLRIRGGRRFSSDAFLLEGKLREVVPGPVAESTQEQNVTEASTIGPRFGLTITKKIGNAVTRNRIRRRLKAAIATVLPMVVHGLDCDYVIVARRSAETKPFAMLVEDLRRGVLHVNRALQQRDAARK